MTRDEAVRTLQSMKSDFPLPKAAQTRRAQNDALDVAIEAMKAEPCEDAVSRQAAIDAAIEAADEWDGGYDNMRDDMITDAIRALPPAQPELHGWICPVCGRGLSPFTMVCPCNNGKGWEITC